MFADARQRFCNPFLHRRSPEGTAPRRAKSKKLVKHGHQTPGAGESRLSLFLRLLPQPITKSAQEPDRTAALLVAIIDKLQQGGCRHSGLREHLQQFSRVLCFELMDWKTVKGC